MGKWIIYLNAQQHFTLVYRNLLEGTSFACGELRRDTPMQMVLKWIVEQAAVRAGDLVKLPDGSIVQFMPPVIERV
jgi:hypothetical protein